MATTRRVLYLCLFTALLLGVPLSSAYGQAITGTLTGVVMDTSQAVIPNANVTLKNEASGEVLRTVTNADGYFSISAIRSGTYTLTIGAQGFTTSERTGIVFNPGDTRTMGSVVLEVGTSTTQVNVTAQAEAVPVDSPEKSVTVSETELQNIAIVGRSAAELIKILPGMAMTGTGVENTPGFNGTVIGINGNGDGGHQSALGYYAVNGLDTHAMEITGDGTHVSDPGCNCATPVNPNVDMIQEFKVQTSNYSAENSQGPTVINSISKSGGKDFHGEAYYSFRTWRMDAFEPELKALLAPGESCDVAIPPAGCPPKNTYKFPGFNIGGPVLIPHSDFNRHRDKMFFFAGYEYFDQHVTSFPFLNATVPTQAMRSGDFSGVTAFGGGGVKGLPQFPVLNSDGSVQGQCASGTGGTSGKPCSTVPVMQAVTTLGAGAIGTSGGCPQYTPASYCSIDPGGSILMNLLPPPNADPTKTTGNVNYVSAPIFAQPMHQWMERLDYSISDNTKLFVTDNLQKETQNFPLGLWWHFGNNVPYPGGVSAKNISHHIASSLTHVFNPTLTNQTMFGFTFVNFPNRIGDPAKVSRKALGYPYTGIYWDPKVDRVPSAFNGDGAWQWMPGGFNPELFAKKYEVSIGDDVDKVIKTHTLKFGFFWEEVTNNQPNSPWDQGLINFQNGGAAAATCVNSTVNPNAPGPCTLGPAGFSTGNTYADELLGHVSGGYSDDTIANLHDEAYRKAEWYINDDWKATPRLTMQLGARFSHLPEWWDRTGNGFAIFDKSKYVACNQNPPDWTCLNSLPGVEFTKKNRSVPLSGRSVKSLFVTPRVGAAYDLFGRGKTVLRGGFGMYRWHFSQTNPGQDISAGFKSAGFGGNLGYLMSQISSFEVGNAKTGVGVIDTSDEEPLVYNWNFTIDQQLPGSNFWEISYVGNASRHMVSGIYPDVNLVPYGAMFGNETADSNNYRPLQDFASIGTQGYQGYSNYNGLQTQLKRAKGRISYTLSYTWSKALGTNVGNGDPANLGSHYKPLDFDRTHILSVAYIIQLPDAAKGWTGAGGALGRGVLNGWQLSGITQYSSSVNLASASSFNANNLANLPNQLATPPSNVYINGSPDYTAMAVVTCDPRKGLTAPHEFINPSCFAVPTPGHNGPWSVPYYLRGPAFINHDLSIFKNFKITESKKLQYRFSAYNFPNHPLHSFGGGYSNLNFGSSDFGIADHVLGHRILEMTFKFYF